LSLVRAQEGRQPLALAQLFVALERHEAALADQSEMVRVAALDLAQPGAVAGAQEGLRRAVRIRAGSS